MNIYYYISNMTHYLCAKGIIINIASLQNTGGNYEKIIIYIFYILSDRFCFVVRR